ncbi:MAG: hypothetical protein R3199_02120 [Gemmatimonadota bacterium]|nr:hypothetical protein [Gemmatimonadota bacterium]
MGLVQREIEEAGLPTVSISLEKEITRRLAPPRALFVRWPFGHPLGEPDHVLQQRRMLWECFRDVRERPRERRGEVTDLGLRWKREVYGTVDFSRLDR